MLLAIAILIGVARYFARILSDETLGRLSVTLRFELLILAGLLYLLAHCCWGSFWVRLLRGQHIPITLYAGLRCYFVSQLGKYIPGKAWVIFMRVGMLRHDLRAHPIPVAVTATYETLTSMAAGALLGVVFLPALGVLPPVVSGNVGVLIGIAALPVLLGVVNKLAARIAAKRRGPDAPPLPSPSLMLLAQGLLHGACGWCLLGLSLGLTIQAIVPDSPPADAAAFLGNLAAVGLAYVLGFVVLVAPGGLGVRELVLQQALTRRFASTMEEPAAAGMAVVVALVLRLVWTIAELILATVLWLRKGTPIAAAHPPEMRQ